MACKTCFVLGAGFSAPAGLPSQSALLNNIAGPGNEKALEHIRKIFGLKGSGDPEDAGDMSDVTLEDVFTFLDKIIAANAYAAGFDAASAYQAKWEIINYIIKDINEKLENLRCETKYERFFTSIANRKINCGETNTIVTFNWDTIPDFYINRAFKHLGRNNGVDYGVYDWPYDDADDDVYVPSILRKERGYKTIKVLKLHGSINWMHDKERGALYVKEQTGSYPEGFCITDDDSKKYEHIFMTPTFIKDFSTLSAKSVWFNAGLDLSDAERVVFAGCSLPLADYEFRNLLLKTAVQNKKNKIRVTIYPKSPDTEKKDIRKRFNSLFKGNTIDFEEVDVEDFLTDMELVWRW